MHELAHILGRHAAVTQYVIGAGVEGDQAVEHAWVWRGIELKKELLHGWEPEGMQAGSFRTRRGDGASRPRLPNTYFGLKGCFAVFDPAITSAAVGLPLSARSMASL